MDAIAAWQMYTGADSTTYPPVGLLVEATLRHCSSGKEQAVLLVRVDEDDVFWRTADDLSKLSYDWDVVAWRAADLARHEQAPVTAAQRSSFARALRRLDVVAQRRGLIVWRAELARQTVLGQAHFELGCWLHFYASFIHVPAATAARTDCMRRILQANLSSLDHAFLAAFDVAPRIFDSLLQADDAMAVRAGVARCAQNDPTGNIGKAVAALGWSN